MTEGGSNYAGTIAKTITFRLRDRYGNRITSGSLHIAYDSTVLLNQVSG